MLKVNTWKTFQLTIAVFGVKVSFCVSGLDITHKAPCKMVADGILFSLIFSEKIILTFFRENKFVISCESSAEQTIHMKCQDLFSVKH